MPWIRLYSHDHDKYIEIHVYRHSLVSLSHDISSHRSPSSPGTEVSVAADMRYFEMSHCASMQLLSFFALCALRLRDGGGRSAAFRAGVAAAASAAFAAFAAAFAAAAIAATDSVDTPLLATRYEQWQASARLRM